MYKDFEEYWEKSGILDTDSYRCIAETYEFTKENIPQAFKSFGRNNYTYGVTEGYIVGKRDGRKEMIESYNIFLDMMKEATDIKTVHEIIDVVQRNIGNGRNHETT